MYCTVPRSEVWGTKSNTRTINVLAPYPAKHRPSTTQATAAAANVPLPLTSINALTEIEANLPSPLKQSTVLQSTHVVPSVPNARFWAHPTHRESLHKLQVSIFLDHLDQACTFHAHTLQQTGERKQSVRESSRYAGTAYGCPRHVGIKIGPIHERGEACPDHSMDLKMLPRSCKFENLMYEASIRFTTPVDPFADYYRTS